MKKVISVNAYADSKTTRYHLKIINYYRKFGLEATLAAFPIVWVNTNSITAIDVKLKVVYAQTFTTKHAKNALMIIVRKTL